jgi:ADP-ribosylglycohydrolase
MQTSLLSRFQGSLVGMSVAQQARVGVFDPTDSLGSTFKNYALLTGASIESIIHCRGLNLDDWLFSTNRLIDNDQILIAVLPIVMYLHEDIPSLQSTIQKIGELQRLDPESIASMMFFATSMAYLLAERCQLPDLIPQVLSALPSGETLVYQQIQLIQQIVVNSAPSNITQLIGEISLAQQPYLMPIAMAIYCFLCNPTNLRLTTQRAAHIPQQSPLTLALAGILVGAAAGMTAIPPSWYVKDISGIELLMQLSVRLLATWAGVYAPGTRLPENYQAIAAPDIIQRR